MRNTEKKAEIEVLSSLSHNYLSFSFKEKNRHEGLDIEETIPSFKFYPIYIQSLVAIAFFKKKHKQWWPDLLKTSILTFFPVFLIRLNFLSNLYCLSQSPSPTS